MHWWKSRLITRLLKLVLLVAFAVGVHVWNDMTDVHYLKDSEPTDEISLLDNVYEAGLSALGILSSTSKLVARQGVYVKYHGRILNGSLYFFLFDEVFSIRERMSCSVFELQLPIDQLVMIKKTLLSAEKAKGGEKTLARLVNICSKYNALAPESISSDQIIGFQEGIPEPKIGQRASDGTHGWNWWYIPIIENETSEGAVVKLVAFNQNGWRRQYWED